MSESIPTPGAPSPALSEWTVPGHPLVTPVPYRRCLAEYAALVRDEIARRRESSFIVAVDLAGGLENEVMAAVRRLPAASVIVDRFSRAIAVLPSSAPIEAVRSFLEADAAFDIVFIDLALPPTGSLGDYRAFVRACNTVGFDRVLRDPLSYGVHPDELVRSWAAGTVLPAPPAGFAHAPEVHLRQAASDWDDAAASPYVVTRVAHMASRVRELEERGIEVLVIADLRHMPGIVAHLDREDPRIDETCVVPTITAPLMEREVAGFTDEVPYFGYLYDLYRGTRVDRRQWLEHLIGQAFVPGDPPDMLVKNVALAERMGLVCRDTAPDLDAILSSARVVCGEEFTTRLLEKALSYPPAEGVVPARRALAEFLSSVPSWARLSGPPGPPGHGDADFLGVVEYGTLEPMPAFDVSQTGWKRVINRNGGGPLERELLDGYRGSLRSSSYYRWKRTPPSYRAEHALARHLLSRFPVEECSDDECCPVEFTDSLELGLDLRQTLREAHLDRVYIREPAAPVSACYVVDFRGPPPDPHDPRFGFSTRFFLDANADWAGVGEETGMRIRCLVAAMFTALTVPVTSIFGQLRGVDPLGSAVALGLAHADRVLVFTDRPGEMGPAAAHRHRVERRPRSAIPRRLLEGMRTFEIAYYRDDDARGD